jgi:hypothetical protein
LNVEAMKLTARFAVTWLAAWLQVIAFAAMPMGPFAGNFDPLGSLPICHADIDGKQAPASPSHGTHDCVLCAACQAHGGSFMLPAPVSAFPERQFVALAGSITAQPRAPPSFRYGAAQPRGPPLV